MQAIQPKSRNNITCAMAGLVDELTRKCLTLNRSEINSSFLIFFIIEKLKLLFN